MASQPAVTPQLSGLGDPAFPGGTTSLTHSSLVLTGASVSNTIYYPHSRDEHMKM